MMKNIYSLIALIANIILKIVGISMIMCGLDKILTAYVPLPRPILNSVYPLMLGTGIFFFAKQLLKEAFKE